MTKNLDGEYQGGFVAYLHRVEETTYLDGPFDAKGKVFLYLKHEIIRNYGDRKPIGMSDIMAATGLGRRQAERAVSALIKGEFIIAHRRKKSPKVLEKSSYELHPRLFGDNYIYNGVKAPLRLITGGKSKNNPPAKESCPPEDDSYPQHTGSDTPSSRQECQYPTANDDGNLPSKDVDSPHDISAKPSSRTPFKKPSLGGLKNFSNEWTKEPTEADIEERKRIKLEEFARFQEEEKRRAME